MALLWLNPEDNTERLTANFRVAEDQKHFVILPGKEGKQEGRVVFSLQVEMNDWFISLYQLASLEQLFSRLHTIQVHFLLQILHVAIRFHLYHL